MKLEGQVRIPSGCAISAVISREGKRMTGEAVINSMVPMHDRSNGLGGGFAAYGIYPEYRDFYAFHIFFEDNTTRRECWWDSGHGPSSCTPRTPPDGRTGPHPPDSPRP